MLAAAQGGGRAVVIGGGLLGLEAAWGLKRRGMDVALVHLMPTLMERQLDVAAGALLRRDLEARGIDFFVNGQTEAIIGEGRAEAVQLADGRQLPPIRRAGDRHPAEYRSGAASQARRQSRHPGRRRHGTNEADIYAVGECIEHNGQVFGLVAPIWEQAKVCGARLAGDTAAVYDPPPVFTSLKITGVDVFSAGVLAATDECDEELTLHDAAGGLYKKVILRDDRVVGSVLYGSVADGPWYVQLMRDKADVSSFRDQIVFGRGFAEAAKPRRRSATAGADAGSGGSGAAMESGVIRTTCPYCGVGCGVRVAADGVLSGDQEHPANYGRLCSKGAALGERSATTAGSCSPDRRPHASVGRSARPHRLDVLADHRRLTGRCGGVLCFRPVPHRGLLRRQQADEGNHRQRQYRHEFAALHGVIGRRSVRAFGEDIVPGSMKISKPPIWSFLSAAIRHGAIRCSISASPRHAEKRGTKVVVIDPRRTSTCDIADIHLALRSGTDVAVFAGLLVELIARGACDES